MFQSAINYWSNQPIMTLVMMTYDAGLIGSYIPWGNGGIWYPSARKELLENRWSTELYSLLFPNSSYPARAAAAMKHSPLRISCHRGRKSQIITSFGMRNLCVSVRCQLVSRLDKTKKNAMIMSKRWRWQGRWSPWWWRRRRQRQLTTNRIAK